MSASSDTTTINIDNVSSSSSSSLSYDQNTIDDIEQRIIELENCLMGHQVLSNDDLLRTPLPYITTSTPPSTNSPASSPNPTRRQPSVPSQPTTTTTTTHVVTNTSLVDATLQSGSNISDQLDKYKYQINNIKTDNDTINTFLNLYKENETLFNNMIDNLDGGVDSSSSIEKLAIILSSEDDIKQTARYLQLLSELEKFINSSNSISSIPSSITSLKPIQALHNEQEAITIALNKKLEQKIQSYNDIVEALSIRFAYWDMILSEYEK